MMAGRRSTFPDRFDLRFKGVGRLNNRHGLTTRGDYRDAVALLRKLARAPLARLDLLLAYKEGRVALAELVAWERDGMLGSALTDLRLRDPLWATVDRLVPTLGKGAETSKRYGVSFKKLKWLGPLGAGARVEDLRRVDWVALRRKWTGSPSDWNHLRRAVSRLLTRVCGDKYHAFRREVVTRIDVEKEVERVPDVPPETFLALLEQIPRPYHSAYWCLLITGARLREYLSLGEDDLLRLTHSVRLPVSKTGKGWRVVEVDPSLWPWLVEGVPAPLGEKRLRYYWHQACDAVGIARVRLHDIRHLFGQYLADAGADERDLQRLLGHATPTMTRRYTQRTRSRGTVALLPGVFPSTPAPAREDTA